MRFGGDSVEIGMRFEIAISRSALHFEPLGVSKCEITCYILSKNNPTPTTQDLALKPVIAHQAISAPCPMGGACLSTLGARKYGLRV